MERISHVVCCIPKKQRSYFWFKSQLHIKTTSHGEVRPKSSNHDSYKQVTA